MSELQLAYILPVQLRPPVTTYYGRNGEESTELVCRVEPNGNVWRFESATLEDVELVLASPPFQIDIQVLRDARDTWAKVALTLEL